MRQPVSNDIASTADDVASGGLLYLCYQYLRTVCLSWLAVTKCG